MITDATQFDKDEGKKDCYRFRGAITTDEHSNKYYGKIVIDWI